MVLPVEDAVVILEAVGLAVAVVEGLAVVVVGLGVVDAGRDAGGPVAGLREGRQTYKTVKKNVYLSRSSSTFVVHSLCW